MPTYALLGADLYLPPHPVHMGGGEDQKAQEKLASRSSLFLQRCRGRNWSPTAYGFLMISPNLHDIWAMFFLILSQDLKLVLLM